TLFSKEFYKIVHSRLKDDGVYAQLFFGPPRDLAHMLKTAISSFPYYKIMPGYENDGFIFIGSRIPFPAWDSPELAPGFARVQGILPSQSWESAPIRAPIDFSSAESLALAVSRLILNDIQGRFILD